MRAVLLGELGVEIVGIVEPSPQTHQVLVRVLGCYE